MLLTKFSMLKRRADSTREEFVRHWRSVHVDVLVNRARHKAYNKRYVQNELLSIEGFADQTFDGAAQMIPQSADVLRRGFQDDPLYQQHVRPDELEFLDVPACAVLYCDTRDVRPFDGGGSGLKVLTLARRGSGSSHPEFAASWRERAHALLGADRIQGAIRGLRQHRVIPDVATRMADGAVIRDAPDIVEEMFFADLDDLGRVCASDEFRDSFDHHGAMRPGEGSHLFVAQEHLVYDAT